METVYTEVKNGLTINIMPDIDSGQSPDGLLRDWNNYLSGNVYGFEILYKDGESLESCWGYYGDYDAKDGVLDEARDCVDGLTNDGETDPNGQFKMIFEQEATK
jgi:hypothetical protein